MMKDQRKQFLKIYANLPLALREEIILTLDTKPITWNVAFVEINGGTSLSKVILGKLEKLEII